MSLKKAIWYASMPIISFLMFVFAMAYLNNDVIPHDRVIYLGRIFYLGLWIIVPVGFAIGLFEDLNKGAIQNAEKETTG